MAVPTPCPAIPPHTPNHLCVELTYNHSTRLIEPYSLRRTKDGNLILHAVKVQTGETRSYRVDRIQGIKVTTQTFHPRYEIEFSQAGPMHISPTSRKTDLPAQSSNPFRARSTRRRPTISTGMKYIFQCSLCGKKFTRSKYDSTMRPHKGKYGDCRGGYGIFLGNKY